MNCLLVNEFDGKNALVTALAAAIDRLVYARYGLTAAESQIVAGAM